MQQRPTSYATQTMRYVLSETITCKLIVNKRASFGLLTAFHAVLHTITNKSKRLMRMGWGRRWVSQRDARRYCTDRAVQVMPLRDHVPDHRSSPSTCGRHMSNSCLRRSVIQYSTHSTAPYRTPYKYEQPKSTQLVQTGVVCWVESSVANETPRAVAVHYNNGGSESSSVTSSTWINIVTEKGYPIERVTVAARSRGCPGCGRR